MNVITTSIDTPATRGPRTNSRQALAICIFSAASLLFAPGLRAQSDEPKLVPTEVANPGSVRLYSLTFSGGSVEDLETELKAAFPNDNVVVTPTARHIRLSMGNFELRDVRLSEVAKTIEFISDSKLLVEVSENEETILGNTWRIGNQLATTPASLFQLKMRSVAAPHLFGKKDGAESVREAAQNLEAGRLKRILESTRAGYNEIVGGARVELLPEQNIMVIIGSEDGVEGLEGFIKAAEQIAAEEFEWKRAQEKAEHDAERKAKEAEILALETARATRDALAEQVEAAEEGIDQKRRLMAERIDELKAQMADKRKYLEATVDEQAKLGPTSVELGEAKAELDAHIRTAERVLAEEEARISAQLVQLQSDLIDLVAKFRAADAKLKK